MISSCFGVASPIVTLRRWAFLSSPATITYVALVFAEDRVGRHGERTGTLLDDDLDAQRRSDRQLRRPVEGETNIGRDPAGIHRRRSRQDLARLRFVASRHRHADRVADVDAGEIWNGDGSGDLQPRRIDDAQDDVSGAGIDEIAGIVVALRDHPGKRSAHDRPRLEHDALREPLCA